MKATVTSCAVPMCTNRQKKGSGLKFYRLPIKNEKLLKTWLSQIGCDTIRVHRDTRICSAHFEGDKKNGKEDVPSIFPSKEARMTCERRERRLLERTPTDSEKSSKDLSVANIGIFKSLISNINLSLLAEAASYPGAGGAEIRSS